MDDFKIWLYVIIGVVYLLSRLRKKSGQPVNGDEESAKPPFNQPASSSEPKPLSFEELLREITETKQSLNPVNQPAPVSKRYVDYDEDIEDEDKNLEEVDYDYRKKDSIYKVYEEAKAQAFVKPSLEETMKLQDTVIKFGRFKEFDEGSGDTLVDQYKRELQDPEGFKKALVMSEILNRRF
ncbi:MAG: hypothetical protein JNM57_11730 [Cyclobacteriaceae bacterium]|nr:hypothetical protein [Cyclobacteriaceae bacterium]